MIFFSLYCCLSKSSFKDFYGFSVNAASCGSWSAQNSNLYLYECLFKTISSPSLGGGLYITGSNLKVLIEQCAFDTCTAVTHGGAIYISSTSNTHVVLNKICGYECSCTSGHYYSFSYIEVGSQMINRIDYVSILRCPNTYGTGYMPIHLEKGIQIVKYMNNSNNVLYHVSAMRCFNGDSLSMIYSTISNNKPSHSICFWFSSGTNSRLMEKCNIKNNSSPAAYGVFYIQGDYDFKDCIIVSNPNTVFSIPSGTVKLDSVVMFDNGNMGSGYYTINPVITIQTPTFQIKHLSTIVCLGLSGDQFSNKISRISQVPKWILQQLTYFIL